MSNLKRKLEKARRKYLKAMEEGLCSIERITNLAQEVDFLEYLDSVTEDDWRALRASDGKFANA